MELASLTTPELIFPQLDCSDGPGLLRLLAERIAEQGYVDDAEKLYERLLEREQLGSTGVGSGVAIPHCKMNGLDRVVVAIGLVKEGFDFGAVDRQPVHLFFFVVSPSQSPAAHLQCLAAISKWVKVEAHVKGLAGLDDPRAIHERLRGGTDDSG